MINFGRRTPCKKCRKKFYQLTEEHLCDACDLNQNKEWLKTTDVGIRERSEKVDSQSVLVEFLYILMRDYLPCGEVEEIMKHHITISNGETNKFSNGWLANYAKDIAERLK